MVAISDLLTVHLCICIAVVGIHERMFFASGWYMSQSVIADASDHLFYWSFLCDRISS